MKFSDKYIWCAKLNGFDFESSNSTDSKQEGREDRGKEEGNGGKGVR
jgi:hypothetical protein